MFRTPLSLVPSTHPITLNSKVLSLGSCFADFIGGRLVKNKFNILVNPFGVIFHPLAQFNIISLALKGKQPPEDTYICNQGVWYNYLFHGSISHTSRVDLEKLVKLRLQELKAQLQELEFLLLTFGTAIQYQHLKTGQVVANCHKVPSQEFDKVLTPIDKIVQAFHKLWSDWGASRPQVILSVSPIRHIKEGLLNNSVSKSTLRVACEQMVESNTMVDYFPGFEIMIDDLRDYRFFERDMIHPNDTARNYIWELFKENYLDQTAREFIEQWQKICLSLEHRPFHPHTPAHQEFLQKALKNIEQLPASIDTTKEIALLKKNLI